MKQTVIKKAEVKELLVAKATREVRVEIRDSKNYTGGGHGNSGINNIRGLEAAK